MTTTRTGPFTEEELNEAREVCAAVRALGTAAEDVTAPPGTAYAYMVAAAEFGASYGFRLLDEVLRLRAIPARELTIGATVHCIHPEARGRCIVGTVRYVYSNQYGKIVVQPTDPDSDPALKFNTVVTHDPTRQAPYSWHWPDQHAAPTPATPTAGNE